MQDPEALRAMSQWLASLPLELVRRRGAHARLQESVDALLQPTDRTSRDKIERMLVAWGQGQRHERAAAARGRLCATVLRVGGELQRAQNRDRPALKAARAWMREVPESALADSPALKRLRTSLFNVEETLQDIHALAAHGVVCTQADGRKRPAWHIEADLCDSLEAAVLHQKNLRGAEQPAHEDPLVRVQPLHRMELLNADSWLQARTPADPDAESLQRDVREVLTYLGCPGTEGPLHLRAVTAGRNVEETAQMLLRAVSLRQRRWRALQSPLTPALRQDDREMPAFSAGFRLTGRRWALWLKPFWRSIAQRQLLPRNPCSHGDDMSSVPRVAIRTRLESSSEIASRPQGQGVRWVGEELLQALPGRAWLVLHHPGSHTSSCSSSSTSSTSSCSSSSTNSTSS